MDKPIASKSQTKAILDAYGLRAKKGYGQNFLIDSHIVQKIAEASHAEDAWVLEIGPGIGALTQPLAKIAKQVTVVEIDPKMVQVLEDTFRDQENVEIIAKDFLKVDCAKLFQEKKKKYGKIVLCSNLPYYVTSPILFQLFECSVSLDSITVMMQKEVADRFKAKPSTKEYGALTIEAQYFCDCKTVMQVPRSVFFPAPKVDSTVLQFIPKEVQTFQDSKAFTTFVKACFAQRRKTLYRNLVQATVVNAQEILEQAGLPADVRAEACSLEQLEEVYRLIQKGNQ